MLREEQVLGAEMKGCWEKSKYIYNNEIDIISEKQRCNLFHFHGLQRFFYYILGSMNF